MIIRRTGLALGQIWPKILRVNHFMGSPLTQLKFSVSMWERVTGIPMKFRAGAQNVKDQPLFKKSNALITFWTGTLSNCVKSPTFTLQWGRVPTPSKVTSG